MTCVESKRAKTQCASDLTCSFTTRGLLLHLTRAALLNPKIKMVSCVCVSEDTPDGAETVSQSETRPHLQLPHNVGLRTPLDI